MSWDGSDGGHDAGELANHLAYWAEDIDEACHAMAFAMPTPNLNYRFAKTFTYINDQGCRDYQDVPGNNYVIKLNANITDGKCVGFVLSGFPADAVKIA